MANYLTLAVAGSGKTQDIVEYCARLPHDKRVLIITYTQANQVEVQNRILAYAGDHPAIEILGWFRFLLRDFARPFIPFKFKKERVCGFNFDHYPHRMAKGRSRFLDASGAVYRSELARLSSELIEASRGALLRRLESIYDEILIDEVQDLSGHDWDILDALLNASPILRMVGDIRQAILSTNPRSQKNKSYAYAQIINWFRERENKGLLHIENKETTWRCHPDVASFSDTIFDASWGFPKTKSANDKVTGHDGVFLIHPDDVYKYIEVFSPQCLRSNANSGKGFDLDYLNFGAAKGMSFERVLVVPTKGISDFLQSGKVLDPIPASKFYVAVTRAEQSVAIVLEKSGSSSLKFWSPEDSKKSAQ